MDLGEGRHEPAWQKVKQSPRNKLQYSYGSKRICNIPQPCLAIVGVCLFESCCTVISRYSLPVFPGVTLSQVEVSYRTTQLQDLLGCVFLWECCECWMCVCCIVYLCVCVCKWSPLKRVWLMCFCTFCLFVCLSLLTIGWPVCMTVIGLWGSVFACLSVCFFPVDHESAVNWEWGWDPPSSKSPLPAEKKKSNFLERRVAHCWGPRVS